MNKTLRDLGYTNEQVAAFSAAIENSGATVFAPCGSTARDTYAVLSLSDAEVAAIRMPNPVQ